MQGTNQCFIYLESIERNLSILKQKLGEDVRIMGIVKAAAYGTDNVVLAKFLESRNVDILGVASVDEGIALRQAGISRPVFVLNAPFYEAHKVVEWDLEIGVSDLYVVEELSKQAREAKKIARAHLHVDTGMSRLGCRPEQALEFAKSIAQHPTLKLEGVMTHFACAECPSHDEFTNNQVKKFDQIIDVIEKEGLKIPWKHAANSSAAMRFHLPRYNMVRIGLALYGLAASEAARHSLKLRLAVSLKSRIVGINHCRKGDTISYGRQYTVEKESQRIAVIPLGYFDGLHRHYSGKAYFIIRGQKAPIVGSICMDYSMANISDIPEAAIGDPVLIFGEDELGNSLSPEEFASRGNSIVHELMTCLGPRIQRVFIPE